MRRKRRANRQLRLSLAALFVIAGWSAAMAAVPGAIGPYRVHISTEPGVIPVGKARLRIDVTDAAGKPMEGIQVRSLVKMPAMSMGEKEMAAEPVPGKPGRYTTEAVFAMEGGYEAAIAISGPLGEAASIIVLATGQNTENAGATGISAGSLLPWVAAALAAAASFFVLFRVRRTGQRIAWKSVVNSGTVAGVLVLLIAAAASRYAIDRWRRPGAMTPIEAQGMRMTTPAPPGTTPVILAEAARGPLENAVSYAGQAIAFNEQDVIARTEGVLNWMPFYSGQKVKAGEVVGRLDINLLHAHLLERQAAVDMASEGVHVSARSHLQSLAEVERIRAELRGKNDAVAGAQAEIAAALEEGAAAEALAASKQSMIAEAESMVVAMEADRQFFQQHNARDKTLFDKGALSMEEYQRGVASLATAAAKVQQAQARQAQAHSELRAAQASARKAEALISASEKKRQQMSSEALAAEAAVRSLEAAAAVAKARIGEAEAGVAQARGSMEVTSVTRGFAELRSQIDGVVTQRLIGPGQLVSPGQAILRIAQTDPIRLQAWVAEPDRARIKVGFRIVVKGQNPGEAPVIANIASIAPTVDPSSRTGIVEAIVPNRNGRFVPGQPIAVEISTGRSEDALFVPLAAIQMRAEARAGALVADAVSYVWAAAKSGAAGEYTVKPVAVKTGVSDGVNIQILTGLEAGQTVVVSGGRYLKADDKVAAVSSEAAR